MSKKTNRRAARTQAALRGALIRLLRRKDYEDITVQEILDEADVRRSTFYAHCSGKDQLLRLSLRLLPSELAAAQQAAQA
jgi:AcrR family transcriptional regulator